MVLPGCMIRWKDPSCIWHLTKERKLPSFYYIGLKDFYLSQSLSSKAGEQERL